MKTLSEVCKIVGVTRRTLQEYHRIGLLSPTSKTEAGYWLYDDIAVNTLISIQVFVEAGFKRLEIKRLFESSRLDLESVFDSTIDRLVKKRNRIDNMIKHIEIIRAVQCVPKRTLAALSKIDASKLYGHGKSFKEVLNENLDEEYQSDDQLDEFGIKVSHLLVSLALLNDRSVDDPAVVACSRTIFDYLIEYIKNEVLEDEDDCENLSQIEVAEKMCEAFDEGDFFTEDTDGLPPPFDSEAIAFCKKAFRHYCQTIIAGESQK